MAIVSGDSIGILVWLVGQVTKEVFLVHLIGMDLEKQYFECIFCFSRRHVSPPAVKACPAPAVDGMQKVHVMGMGRCG
ncbi:hypothetical protein [Niveispirillum sp.]|uniref:hypothetical protein n=1 Tax=Niveispirillum sp. TaxID=1917217 RepID=UPI001B449646|nr:hypothetical protein [Niveispirillum sp.]MBP7337776.1 hypothetical protein [Niveispirillum sp.]